MSDIQINVIRQREIEREEGGEREIEAEIERKRMICTVDM